MKCWDEETVDDVEEDETELEGVMEVFSKRKKKDQIIICMYIFMCLYIFFVIRPFTSR